MAACRRASISARPNPTSSRISSTAPALSCGRSANHPTVHPPRRPEVFVRRGPGETLPSRYGRGRGERAGTGVCTRSSPPPLFRFAALARTGALRSVQPATGRRDHHGDASGEWSGAETKQMRRLAMALPPSSSRESGVPPWVPAFAGMTTGGNGQAGKRRGMELVALKLAVSATGTLSRHPRHETGSKRGRSALPPGHRQNPQRHRGASVCGCKPNRV